MAARGEISTPRWLLGLFQASVFSLVYLLAPIYIISAILFLWFQYPSKNAAWLYAGPLILSYFSKPKAMPDFVRKYLRPMADYFQYEEISEFTYDDFRKAAKEQKKYILASQPHGVISFCGMCAAVNIPEDLTGIETAVASVLLRVPILKHVLGIYGLVDASGRNFKKKIQQEGINGSVVVYVGGIAELFKSSRKEERLYLSKRKGFVKYALQYGVDIIPVYLFGNTSILTVVKSGPIAKLSRKLQMSVTYFWGKYNLPIPRDDKLLYVRGKPLGMPHIPNPTDEDINKWHTLYCEEVVRLFDTYKKNVPLYKDKTLFID